MLFNNLPNELQEKILSCLIPAWHQILMMVCRRWYHIIVGIRNASQIMLHRETPIYIFVQTIPLFKWIIENELNDTKSLTKYGIREQLCPWASYCGKLDILKYAVENNFKLNVFVSDNAAINGHIHILKWLHKKCPWDEHTINYAASNGHNSAVEFLYSKKCPINKRTFGIAAANGNFELMEWLYKNKCPWDKTVCEEAATNKDLNILKWLRMRGCPWSRETVTNAAINGYLDTLKWLYVNNCPWSGWATYSALQHDQYDAYEWIRDNVIA